MTETIVAGHAELRERLESIVLQPEVPVTPAELAPAEVLFTTVAEAERILRGDSVFQLLTELVREG